MLSLKGKKLLLVDDEEDLVDLLKDEFEFEGAEVSTANNGLEAYALSEQTAFDLVISDIRMPKSDGAELLRKIRVKHPKIPPLILMSGFSDYTHEQLSGWGAFKILAKPLSPAKLVQAAKEALKD